MWVYIQTENNLFTVGFYDPEGGWHIDTDWETRPQVGPDAIT